MVLSDEGGSVEVFSSAGDDTELKDGICIGILKNGGTMDDGMGISIEVGVIDLGKHVAS